MAVTPRGNDGAGDGVEFADFIEVKGADAPMTQTYVEHDSLSNFSAHVSCFTWVVPWDLSLFRRDSK